jgi:hypothetical protein
VHGQIAAGFVGYRNVRPISKEVGAAEMRIGKASKRNQWDLFSPGRRGNGGRNETAVAGNLRRATAAIGQTWNEYPPTA